jgi:hypothetical protein
MSDFDFYSTHAPMSDLGEFASVADSDDVRDLVARVQGIVMHPFHAQRYGLTVPPEAEQQLQNRSVQQVLRNALAIDSRPLTEPRPPEKRTYGNCRHFATLLTSLLRERGIPARSRCGFGAYFPPVDGPGKKVDHWVTEMWDADAGRWRLVDPQIDDVQRKEMNITIDTLDLGREDFWVAGQAWQRCREDAEQPEDFGILDMWGWWFIRDNLLRDLASLNKVELLPWDAWGQMGVEIDDLSDEQQALCDHVAALTTAPQLDVDAIHKLYREDESLRVPETILSFRPQPGPVEIGELANG